MQPIEFIAALRALLLQFLEGELSGKEMVSSYDGLMADDLPDCLDGYTYRLLDEFHTEFALFVPNEEVRNEEPAYYYGPAELRLKVCQLLKKLSSPRK